ncbi:MAG: hypothetical protein HOP13_13770 [Alphaproteobacteria bacterium]|nr:hypothetical protein [Alphaproteobacteria bacterium]
MSGADWKELETLWRDLPERAAPAVAELKRMKRWRWASRALIVGDIVMTVVGLGIGVWLVSRGDLFAVVMGVATLAFVPVAAGLSFWARWVRTEASEAPVQEALDLAVKNARVSVRLGTASMWTVFLGILFTAILAFARAFGDLVATDKIQGVLLAIGAAQVWLALVLGASIVYYGRRRADLARLERLRDAFREQV